MKTRSFVFRFLPLIIFSFIVIILAFFLYELKQNPAKQNILKSQLIGNKIPNVIIQQADNNLITNDKELDFEKYKNRVFAVNFFASWCAPCRVEHEVLEKYSKDQIIIGIAYKDDISSVKRFLKELGDPYDVLMLDPKGRAAIDLGLYGVPETYFIDSKGKIKYRQVGPLTVKKFENILKSLKVN